MDSMKFCAEYITNQYTEDGLKLPMFHFEPEGKDICVIHLHGMCDSFVSNYFGSVWGERFRQAGIGYIYLNTRGYSYVNDIEMIDGTKKQYGCVNEILEEAPRDIDLGIDTARELGYRRILLLGHSYGCNKALYYCTVPHRPFDGIIFASIPDVPGFVWKYQEDLEHQFEIARRYIAEGHPKKNLPDNVEDVYYYSAEALIDWYNPKTILNNFPVNEFNETDNWEDIKSLTVPSFSFSGDLEQSFYHRIDLVKEKAVNCPDFEYAYVEGADHYYIGREHETAELMIDWIKRKF